MMMMMIIIVIIIIIIIIIHSFYIALFSSLEQTQCAGISHVILNEWLPFIARIINIHGSGVLVVPQRWLCSPHPPPPAAPLSPASLSHHQLSEWKKQSKWKINKKLLWMTQHNMQMFKGQPLCQATEQLDNNWWGGGWGGGECRLLICFWYWH